MKTLYLLIFIGILSIDLSAQTGCTNQIACNYDPVATTEDGSCTYPGCTDSAACNFDPNAGCDSGTCSTSIDPSCGICIDGTTFNGIDFTWVFAPENWTTDLGIGDGTVTHEIGALNIIGNDNGSNDVNTIASTTALRTGTISFDWAHWTQDDFPSYDPAFVSIDGVQTILPDLFIADQQQFGSESFPINEGNNLHFGVNSVDGVLGRGFLLITNFQFTPDICGCTDPLACNFDSAATSDNGSCTFPGCTDPSACNFDPTVGCDDGSCCFESCLTVSFDFDISFGTPDFTIYQLSSYDPNTDEYTVIDTYTTGQFSLSDEVLYCLPSGCYYFEAIAAGGSATMTWLVEVVGGQTTGGSGPDSLFTVLGNGSCFPDGCTDPSACNFDPNAPNDDGSCILPDGCTDPLACNFDVSNNCEDGSCIYPDGCTDPGACNFDPGALCDDGSCCNTQCLILNKEDAFGDGWNDATFDLYDNTDPNNPVLITSIGFTEFQDQNGDNIEAICILDGCYIFDFGGGEFDNEMSLTIDGADQGQIITGPISGFTFTINSGFCLAGCTDVNACNFDPNVTLDDGSCFFPPINDLCENAIDLGSSSTTVVISNQNACQDENFSMSCSVDDDSAEHEASIYFSFDFLDPNTEVIIGLDDSNYPCCWGTELTIYDGCGGNEISCQPFGNDILISCGTLNVGTYIIQVDGSFGDIGTADLNLTINENVCLTECNDPLACNFDPNATSNVDCCFDNCVALNLMRCVNGWDGNHYEIYSLNTGVPILIETGSYEDPELQTVEVGVRQAILCLPDGCYEINVLGGIAFSCVEYTVLGTDDGPVDGSVNTGPVQFSINTSNCVIGCTDPLASNFDSAAGIDDGSCCLENYLTIGLNENAFTNHTWELYDSSDLLIASGAGDEFIELCLIDGCYRMEMFDLINQNGWGQNFYALTDFYGNILAQGSLQDAQIINSDFPGATGIIQGTDYLQIGFGSDCPILGCSDPLACNFDSSVTLDDGSCGYNQTGCTDPIACNWNPLADCDDGSCNYLDNPSVDLTQNIWKFSFFSDPGVGNSCSCFPGGSNQGESTIQFMADGTWQNEFSYSHGRWAMCGDDFRFIFEGEFQGQFIYSGTYDCVDGFHGQITFEDDWPDNSDPEFCFILEDGVPGCLDPVACNYNPAADIQDASCEYGNNNPDLDLLSGQWYLRKPSFGSDLLFDCFCDDLSTVSFTQFPIQFFDFDGYLEAQITELDESGIPLSTNFATWSYCGSNFTMVGDDNEFTPNENCNHYGTSDCNSEGVIQGQAFCDNGFGGTGSGCFMILPEKFGCNDFTACNYDVYATTDDGSCLPSGCTNPEACNYDPNAFCSNHSCILVETGCNDPTACNYDPADECDGDCIPSGCTDVSACNFNPQAGCDDGSCSFDSGCTDINALNYNPYVICDDGSCLFEDGCTDANAVNFDANAITDDGTCIIVGCTNSEDPNYNPSAMFDDGSCQNAPGPTCIGDLNGDLVVTTADLLALLGVFGSTCD